MAPPVVLALRTCCFALLLLASPSLAGAKLDLSPYLANLGSPGDFKVFSMSNGGERRIQVLGVERWGKKGWKEIIETEVTGAGPEFDGTFTSEEYLIPGKQRLTGSEFIGAGNVSLALLVKKPAKGLKLLQTPGKVQKIKKKARLWRDNVEIGTALRLGLWIDAGLDTVATPSGTYPNALRAFAASLLLLEDGFDELVYVSDLRHWYAVGVGLVRSETALEFYLNGRLTETESWTEELSSGRINGVPFP